MEKRLAFAYGRSLALSRIVMFVLVFALIGILLVLAPSIPIVPVALFLVLLGLATILFGISPLLTQHWLTRSRLILRQGWYFRTIFAFSEIRSLRAADPTMPIRASLGIHRPLGRPTLFVAGGRTGLMIVQLDRPRRFWSAFGLEASEVVFDVTDPKGLLRAYEERRNLLAPVQANRANPDLRD